MDKRHIIEKHLTARPMIRRRLCKCGQEPAMVEAFDQCRFALLRCLAQYDHTALKGHVPIDLYEMLQTIAKIRVWSMLLEPDLRKALMAYEGSKRQAAQKLKMPYTTYRMKLDQGLERLCEIIPDKYLTDWL